MFGYIVAGIIGGLIAKGKSPDIVYYGDDYFKTRSEGWTPCPKCQPNGERFDIDYNKTGCRVSRRGSNVTVQPCPTCGSRTGLEILIEYGYYR